MMRPQAIVIYMRDLPQLVHTMLRYNNANGADAQERSWQQITELLESIVILSTLDMTARPRYLALMPAPNTRRRPRDRGQAISMIACILLPIDSYPLGAL